VSEADNEAFETELDAYRDRVSKPLVRLCRAYGVGEWRWPVPGVVTCVLTYSKTPRSFC
jgi:ATP-binding cassette subfamily B protein